jgi:hypothetical protein
VTEEKPFNATIKPPRGDAGLAERLVDWMKKSVEAGEQVEAAIPRWIRILAIVTGIIFYAFIFGLFGKRLYIAFIAFWLVFAAVQTRARLLFPQFPNFAFFMGWLILAFMAVGIGAMILNVELGSP